VFDGHPFETGGDPQANRHKGKTAEEIARAEIAGNGYSNITPVHKGADFKAQDPVTGQTKFFEVKTGNSSLTKAQKRKRREVGPENYEIMRYPEPPR
jgi:hypothetical protein